MHRLEWHCHTKSVSGALYKAILYHGQSAGKEMANSAVFNFRRNAGSDWISLTEVGREFQARDVAAGNARSPMVARRVGGIRRVSTSKQTGDNDVLVHQPSTEVSQQGTVGQYHGGNDVSEHTNEIVFFRELSTSVLHGKVAWCVLTSLQRTPVEQWHSTQTALRALQECTRYTSQCWMIDPRASGMHPVDSTHVNVGFVKTENLAKIHPIVTKLWPFDGFRY